MPHDTVAARPALGQPFEVHAPSRFGCAPQSIAAPRIMFMYWGRRGLSRFVCDLMAATADAACADASLSLSRQNHEHASFVHLGPRLSLVDTFTRPHGAITGAWRIPMLRRELAA